MMLKRRHEIIVKRSDTKQSRGGKMMKSIILDGNKMKEIASKSASAELAALSLSVRQRRRYLVNLDLIRNDLKRSNDVFSDQDYMEYWKALQAEGLGEIIPGGFGEYTRFIFKYDPRAIGRASIEGETLKAAPIKLFDSSRALAQIGHKTRGWRGNGLERPSGSPVRLSVDVPENVTEETLRNIIETMRKLAV